MSFYLRIFICVKNGIVRLKNYIFVTLTWSRMMNTKSKMQVVFHDLRSPVNAVNIL